MPGSEQRTMHPSVYPGLFFVTLGTLMYEVLLPRIFSVTMFYHFAFMALSVAMFGMTAGALLVYLRPERYTTATAHADLTASALQFALSLVASLYAYLHLPFLGTGGGSALLLVALSYVLVAIPFVFSGICVAIALTRFPAALPRLYGTDLAGSALGCPASVWVLSWTDGPTAGLVIAVVVAIGAACFASAPTSRKSRRLAWLGIVVLGAAALGNHALAARGEAVLRVVHRAFAEVPRVHERWNSYSYVEVLAELPGGSDPLTLGWGMSSKTPTDLEVHQMAMSIDIKAGTAITRFDGDTRKLEFLRYDITNAVHALRRDADVCIVGVGGGRDVLAALYFDQRSVFGIELNQSVYDALTRVLGDYSGHLDRHPKVSLVVDEARSRLARGEERCDILQISLIDTFAATAAGAFVLAENSLYTEEAWELFLERLKPGGILTVSRYYFHQRPAEAYRTLALAVAALKRRGVVDLRRHLVLLKNERSLMAGRAGIGTLLVSRDPLSAADLDALNAYAADLSFDVVLSPTGVEDPVLATIAGGRNLDAFYASYEIDVSPPTDDRPFFFQMLRLRDVFKTEVWNYGDVNWKNLKAILVLATLLGVVLVLTALCIWVPWRRLSRRSGATRHVATEVAYFGAIGFGFMLIEVAQVQRFSLLLGRPTYALSVVLFALLLGTGLGSLLTGEWLRRYGSRSPVAPFVTLLVVVATTGAATPGLLRALASHDSPVQLAASMLVLLPLGLVLGIAFPVGMRRAQERDPLLLPWLWGVNGASSVCSSVVAMVIALSSGIGAAYWVGAGCYVVAAALALRPSRQ